MTLIAGKWRRLLFAGNGRRSVYDEKRQSYAEDNRTCRVRICKSEAAMNNNERHTRGIVLLKLTSQTGSIARPLCDCRATYINHDV